ncbi:MAG: cytochrome c [Gemmatimonadetes bacterium]|nr:cytochrome c [Gemmatimonadota bacterium]
MIRVGWTLLLSACMLTGHAKPGEGQTGTASSRSTLAGVYLAQQAEKGQELYAGRCRSCHTQAAHIVSFKSAWTGQSLAEPFQYLMDEMPKDNPGTLSAEETADLVAYFLRLIGMPAGTDSLSADPEALKSIQIDTLATPSRPG